MLEANAFSLSKIGYATAEKASFCGQNLLAIYLLQLSKDQELASAFSVRPTPLATVSMPIKWDRLIDILPTDFTLLNVPEIIKKSGNPWKQMLEDRQDILSIELMDNNNWLGQYLSNAK